MEIFSIIVPVYNRPQETAELLESLACGQAGRFEVIIVEDGSQVTSRAAVEKYAGRIDIKYFFKENGGPAAARNYGAQKASGDYLVFMDSDCIAPPGYMEALTEAVREKGVRFFGGPDKAHPSFTPFQKAVNYSMTSRFTTGGIRGSGSQPANYYPRSFNMGVAREVFESVGGFDDLRLGEDPDLSIRIIRSGTKPTLLRQVWVYHKRRTDFASFFRQVFRFGVGRASLGVKYPETAKAVYLLPSAAVIASLAWVAVSVAVSPWLLLAFLVPAAIWLTESALKNRSLRVGLLSVPVAFTQIFGYGAGYLAGWWNRKVLHKSEADTFARYCFRPLRRPPHRPCRKA